MYLKSSLNYICAVFVYMCFMKTWRGFKEITQYQVVIALKSRAYFPSRQYFQSALTGEQLLMVPFIAHLCLI